MDFFHYYFFNIRGRFCIFVIIQMKKVEYTYFLTFSNKSTSICGSAESSPIVQLGIGQTSGSFSKEDFVE